MAEIRISSSFTIGEISLNGLSMTGYTYVEGDTGEPGKFLENTPPVVYELVEISAPPGYIITEKSNYFKVRGILDTTVTTSVKYTGIEICLTDEDGNDLTDEEGHSVQEYQNVKVDEALLTISLTNQSGVELPETGGPGKAWFFILGGILIAGAGALLLMKKRDKAA